VRVEIDGNKRERGGGLESLIRGKGYIVTRYELQWGSGGNRKGGR